MNMNQIVLDMDRLERLVRRGADCDDACMSVRGWGDGPCNCGAERRALEELKKCLGGNDIDE